MSATAKKAALLLIAVLLTVAAPLSAAAYGAVDTAREGSLTVEYPFANAAFRLYRVADISSGAHFIPCGEFADDAVAYDELDTADWRVLAQTLAGFAERDDRTPAAQQTTDGNGTLAFEKLPTGLYLLIGTAVVQDGVRYTPAPTLLSLPQRTVADTWDYAVTVAPKYEEEPETAYTACRVVKVWKDTPGEVRPQSVQVQLLCDGAVYDTVTLSAANDWRHSWEQLDAACVWQVTETAVPAHFTVTVEQTDTVFVVTNTYRAPSLPPDDPKLPQTGQLWWPVYPLAASGILLFAVGWVRRWRVGNKI